LEEKQRGVLKPTTVKVIYSRAGVRDSDTNTPTEEEEHEPAADEQIYFKKCIYILKLYTT